jgi:hypothetical protein
LSFALTDERAFAFLEHLQKQFKIYCELLLISDQQGRLVERSDEDGLMKVMAEKQGLISKLESLGKEFGSERELLEKVPMGEFSCIDPEIDKVLDATEQALHKLVERETRDMNHLDKLQEENMSKISHLDQGQSLTKAYLGKSMGSKMDRSV